MEKIIVPAVSLAIALLALGLYVIEVFNSRMKSKMLDAYRENRQAAEQLIKAQRTNIELKNECIAMLEQRLKVLEGERTLDIQYQQLN